MSKKQILDYSIGKIDEYILKVKSDMENKPDYAENKIKKILDEYRETTDIIKKYDSLTKAYITCAEDYLLLYNDVKKFKGYSYLAAKAGEICFELFEKGHRTYRSSLNENLRTKNNIFYYARYAIFANRWDIAISLVQENSLLQAILLKDSERCKDYLPENFKDIPKSNDMEKILWSIVYSDEKKMNSLLEKSIRELRRMAKSFPAVCIDSGDLAFAKLAKERGMSFDLNVIELPIHLLDDEPIDENEWKLPEDEELLTHRKAVT